MIEKSKTILTFFGQIIGYLIILFGILFIGYFALKFVVDLFLNWYYSLGLLVFALPIYLSVEFESKFWGVIALFTMIFIPLLFNIYHPPIKDFCIDFFPFSLKIKP